MDQNTHVFAACSVALSLGADGRVPSRIMVLPMGEFAAVDGRPFGMPLPDGGKVQVKKWRLGQAQAQGIAARLNQRGLDIVVDYEHQTLNTEKNGLPAPAMAWLRNFAAQSDGLWADVTWTPPGENYVANKQYRYLSPVFGFDHATGDVSGLQHVALTNAPGLNNLPALAALSQFFSTHPQPGEPQMDKTAVLVALSLAQGTSDETALTAIAALKSRADAAEAQVASLKASQFDPAKHIPLSEHAKVADQLASLKADQEKQEHAGLLQAALSDGRILAVSESYWAAQPLAALSEFLKTAQPMAALKGMQSQGKKPAAAGASAELDAEGLRTAALKYQKDQRDAGVSVDWVTAVSHVSATSKNQE